MDIIQCLQKKVDKIVKEKYKGDDCSPSFIVSLLFESNKKEVINHKIIMTVQHLSQSFSKIIFPQIDKDFGYETIEYEMERLYNRTM